MTQVLARGSARARRTVPVHGPDHSVTTEILRIQASARRRSFLARLFGQDPIRPDARIWYRAALAEIGLAKTLTTLPEGWHVLHPIQRGVGDPAAHLLIGPTGVFTISVKDHSAQRIWVGEDQLLVNGHRTHHIEDARREASRISSILGAGPKGPVVPIVAIVDPASLTLGHDAPDDVTVIRADRLEPAVLRRPASVSAAAADALALRAVRSGDLAPSRPALEETLRHTARFARVKHEVDAAWRRRMIWTVLGAALPVAAAALGVVLS
ncbi:hypothetical protein BH09ACT5_BH09ACT5_01500 [soil metagenome]